MWTYLTTPYLFNLPEFIVEEIEPWEEGGEKCGRLKIIFPDYVPSYSKEQTFYFDRNGILRRHDYAADILGGLASANYAYNPTDFGGLIIPTQRRVYARGVDNKPLFDRLAVSIDINSIRPLG